MIIGFTRIIKLPSGNTAQNFHAYALSDGRVRIQYVYTDRRRAHQVSRHYTAEFLNGHLQSITARSACGGRIEYFASSTIIDELLEMLDKFNEMAQRDAYEETETEQDSVTSTDTNTDNIADLKFLWGVEMIHLVFTFFILLSIWYNS